jgi:DNA-binding NarL/FixJ family response regulator
MPNEARNGKRNVDHRSGEKLEVVLIAASGTRRWELRDALASRFVVSAEFSSLGSLLENVGIASGVIVLDFPDRRPSEVQNRELENLEALLENPALSAVALIENVERAPLSALLAFGNVGLLGSDPSPGQLEAAIIAASAGLVTVDPEIASHTAGQLPHEFRDNRKPVEELTRREVEVLRLLARGFGNKEIATRLGISEHTAKFHISSILGKLGVSSRTEAVTEGLRRGLILL